VTGGTSTSTGVTAGAAAMLTSRCLPFDTTGVRTIANTLAAEGTYAWDDSATEVETNGEEEFAVGWEEEPTDNWKEPLLNFSDPSVFDPKMDGDGGAGDCDWLERPAPSDIDGDRRSDLTAIASDGEVRAYRGMMEGSNYGPGGFDLSIEEFSPGLRNPLVLDRALLDGTGDYVVDLVDMDGDGRDDLITWKGSGGVRVHLGKADRSFEPATGFAVPSTVKVGLNGSGPWEPVGVADVDGDGTPDLVAVNDTTDAVGTFPGTAAGDFEDESVTSTPKGLDTALYDGVGNYFLDVEDVDGDSSADLVSMNTDGKLYVYEGRSDGTFDVATNAGTANSVFDDGSGEEPVGIADVNGDRRADLLTLSDTDNKLRLRVGEKGGTFAAATTPLASTIASSLLDGTGSELIGLLDYNRDGLADLVALGGKGEVLTYRAQVNGGVATFASPIDHGGEIDSVRGSATGVELASEKPMIRRKGCTEQGCEW